MNRREFLGTSIAAGIYSARSEMISPLLSEDRSAPQDHAAAMPDWLHKTPIIMAGCWDDFPLYQKRRGGTSTWLGDLYRQQSSNATMKALKEAGITLGIIHFFKGFGLEAEREHIEDAQVLSRKLKDNGIRVGLYVGGTIAYETFLLEKPDAETWFVPDYLGKPVYYGEHTFRRLVYFMHPGYREYIKRVIRYGLERLDADLIHFDNTSEQAHPAIFMHPMAIDDFRKYLVATYSAVQLHERLGFSDMRYVTAPRLIDTPVLLNDPLLQMWAEFRCHQLTSYYAEMASLIRSIKPDAAVENNPGGGVLGSNVVWGQGIDYARLLGTVDIAWTEIEGNATVSKEGGIVSKISIFKAASIQNKKTFCYTWGAAANWGYSPNRGSLLDMAESMVYNRQCLGMVGIFDGIQKLPPGARRYIQFYRDNFEIYRGVESVADVAILYSFSSIGFNSGRPTTSFMLACQMLIQSRFLFDIIFDQHLDDLSKYRVLLLADQESLSDYQVQRVRDFVMQGGGLVATGHTSLYTERRIRRRDFGLKDCFGVSAPRWNGSDFEEPDVPGGSFLNHAGKGKVTYIPQITPPRRKLPIQNPWIARDYWDLPQNCSELRNAVLAVLDGPPTARVISSTPPYVTIELVHQQIENRLVLHVLNYDHSRTPEIEDLGFEVSLPERHKVKNVRAFSPDELTTSRQLEWKGEQQITFRIPKLQIYTAVAIDVSAPSSPPA